MLLRKGTGPLCAALLLLQGTPLFGQPIESKPAPAEASEITDKARELYTEGSKALIKGRAAEAYANLLAAWGLKKHYQIAGNLGAAEVQLGRYRDAAEHLSYYLREAPKTREKERQTAQSLLNEARGRVGAVMITVEPAGAEVLVEGTPVGKAPLAYEVFVEPGERTIEARFDGYKTAKATVVTAAGTWADVPLRLVKSEANAEDAAGVGINRKNGSPTVREEADGESPQGGPRKALIIAGAATGVLALGAGAVFTALSNAHGSDADAGLEALLRKGGGDPCSMPALANECSAVEDSLSASATFAHAALWSFIAGGVVGTATVVYGITTPKAAPGARVQALPMIKANGAGLIVVGQW